MAETADPHGGEEKRDPTELSIGNIVAWAIGALSVLVGVIALFSQPVMGIGFLVAGLFGMPPTRKMIENEFNVVMSRWFTILGYLVLIFLFAGISQAGS